MVLVVVQHAEIVTNLWDFSAFFLLVLASFRKRRGLSFTLCVCLPFSCLSPTITYVFDQFDRDKIGFLCIFENNSAGVGGTP